MPICMSCGAGVSGGEEHRCHTLPDPPQDTDPIIPAGENETPPDEPRLTGDEPEHATEEPQQAPPDPDPGPAAFETPPAPDADAAAPLPDYSGLTAREIADIIEAGSLVQYDQVIAYEQAHDQRKTILNAKRPE